MPYFCFIYAALVATGGITDFTKVSSTHLLASLPFLKRLADLFDQVSWDPKSICAFPAASERLAGIMPVSLGQSEKCMLAGLHVLICQFADSCQIIILNRLRRSRVGEMAQ